MNDGRCNLYKFSSSKGKDFKVVYFEFESRSGGGGGNNFGCFKLKLSKSY